MKSMAYPISKTEISNFNLFFVLIFSILTPFISISGNVENISQINRYSKEENAPTKTSSVSILPENPKVCFEATGTSITAQVEDGERAYVYLWNTGETTPEIFVGAGTYSVTISTENGQQIGSETVEVIQNINPISAYAGEDRVVCLTDLPIVLEGSVKGADSSAWLGDWGQFSYGNAPGITTYKPSAFEIANGSATLVLSTKGTGNCPAASDTVTYKFNNFNADYATSSTPTSYFGGNDGTATVTVTGNQEPYTCVWNTRPIQVGTTAKSLPAGRYEVALINRMGCGTTISVTVSEPTVQNAKDIHSNDVFYSDESVAK